MRPCILKKEKRKKTIEVVYEKLHLFFSQDLEVLPENMNSRYIISGNGSISLIVPFLRIGCCSQMLWITSGLIQSL